MEEDKALKKFITEQLEKGYIRKLKSPYASAFFFIKKKDGKLHPIQDYWCNGHYNRMPDLGKCEVRQNTWDLAKQSILDTKVLDCNVTWLTKHKDTS